MSTRLAASLALCVFFCLCFEPGFLAAQFVSPNSAERGRQLFSQEWEPIENNGQSGADGLGPMFNAKSCVACHNLGGVGGAGDNSTNVQLMSVLPRQKSDRSFRTDDWAVQSMFENARDLHPDFAISNSTVLHRSSTRDAEFADWQRDVLDFKSVKKARDDQFADKLLAERTRLLEDKLIYRVRKEDPRNRFTLQISRRNTPALFGVSTIDSIDPDDIRAIALKQSKQDGPVKGIVAHLPDRKVGKFGWRGEHSSVRDFTVQACAVELGLSNSLHPQSVSPFPYEDDTPPVSSQPSPIALFIVQLAIRTFPIKSSDPFDDSPFGTDKLSVATAAKSETPEKQQHDMTDQQVKDMIQFVNSLSALVPIPASSEDNLKVLSNGRDRFDAIGCAQCHVPDVGTAKNVFSDFLLHDMGTELADAAGAIKTKEQSIDSNFHFQKDGFEIDNDQLWQTPPLWGVALSAPYMHDGRAKDLLTAIKMHAGEASQSVEKFQELSREEQRELLSFLNSLGDGGNIRPFNSPVPVASGGWSSPRQSPRGRLAGRRR